MSLVRRVNDPESPLSAEIAPETTVSPPKRADPRTAVPLDANAPDTKKLMSAPRSVRYSPTWRGDPPCRAPEMTTSPPKSAAPLIAVSLDPIAPETKNAVSV